jgi:3-oxoacyl-[acyl-carrier-protein] synthase III
MPAATISGIGSYAPEGRITNRDLERIVETSDEWIISHTGMRERRIAAPEQNTSDLGFLAAQRALESAGLTAADLDLVLCATISGDMIFPATACLIQDKLGAKCGAFDIASGCTGFVIALSTAASFVRSGDYRHVMVIAAETLTRITNWTDRSTCVLFGDAAGAAVVSAGEAGTGLLSHELLSVGESAGLLSIPAGGTRRRVTPEASEQHLDTMYMNGPEVFKLAVRLIPDLAERVVTQAGLKLSDIDLVVMHQANQRILDAAARRLDVPDDKFYSIVADYGNASAASMPLALDLAHRAGRLHPGDNVLLVGFGAGFALGGAVLRWTL